MSTEVENLFSHIGSHFESVRKLLHIWVSLSCFAGIHHRLVAAVLASGIHVKHFWTNKVPRYTSIHFVGLPFMEDIVLFY